MSENFQNVYVAFYEIPQGATSPASLTPLCIDNQQIRFFQDTLYKDCEFCCNDAGWWLTYFKGSAYEERYHVTFTRCSDNEEYSTLNQRSRHTLYGWPVFTAVLICYREDHQRDSAAEKASQAIRKTKSITYTCYEQAQYNALHVDGRGLSLLTKLPNQSKHFERKLLLLALGHAYLVAIEKLYNKLALTVKDKNNVEELEKVYQEAAEFNARFYFPQPVKVQRSGLVSEWGVIEKALGITRNNAELAMQINNIHYIINLKMTRQAQEREQQRNKWLAIFGLILTALSLLELFK